MIEDFHMGMMDTSGKISLKQKAISLEQDPAKKQDLQKQLLKLRFRQQIEALQRKIDQLTQAGN
ncbi:MAG: hypothetical protein QM737_12750 [Ferruginibacter sp.]